MSLKPRALLVALRSDRPGAVDVEESLGELSLLTEAAGAEVHGVLVQRRDDPDPATFVGSGKLAEVAAEAESLRVHVVIFDDPLSPAQLRNIEGVVGCLVLDRNQVILDIFACRARTREGKLEVELAQLEYLLPRLGGRGVDLSRLGAGIGTRGPGETKLEDDRRKIRARIAKIRRALEKIVSHRREQGRRRRLSQRPSIALVGYTNGGKSTLFRSLTGEEVMVSSQPFSTLDPLIRRLPLPNGQTALLSDTVGFIRKLPHGLVVAFRATLEEVREADVLLNVIDVSAVDPDEQVAAVEEVLAELELGKMPRIDVLNKTDRLDDPSVAEAMLPRFRHAVATSAIEEQGLDELLARIVEVLGEGGASCLFRIPQDEGAAIADLYEHGKVLRRWYDDGVVVIRAEVAPSLVDRYRSYVVDEAPGSI